MQFHLKLRLNNLIVATIKYVLYMDLEWDEDKRRLNLANHGLDFSLADKFDFDNATYIPDERKDYGEARIIATSYLGDKICVLCFTMRNGTLRIISFRKANDREKRTYQRSLI